MDDQLTAFAADLRRHSAAEIYIDTATRLLYSTDASLYQIMPLAVVIPRHYDDVLATVETCRQYRLPMLPRGGGSGLAGQTVGEAVVIDFTRYLDEIVRIDASARRVLVQAGLPLGLLNRRLRPYGLMVGPDPASADRAAVAGCIGNNATGSHSIVYGKMADHVLSLRVVLADGSDVRLGPRPWSEIRKRAGASDSLNRLYSEIAALIETHAELIDRRFPRFWRRSSGYNLDYLRRQLDDQSFNLAPLLAGSEGTLGLILEAELQLVPVPPHKALAILHYDDTDTAFRSVPDLLTLNPSAIELVDDMLMRLTRESPGWRERLTFVEGEPAAVFIVEFAGESPAYLDDRLQALAAYWQKAGCGRPLIPIKDARGQENVWAVRKAGLNLLSSMRGDAKPVPGIEDMAVPPEHLADYMRELRELLDGRGVVAAMYAHASAGCIHTRPVLNLKTADGVRHLIELINGAAQLAMKYGGVPSSEHGDGLARSFLNPELFGPELYEVLRQVKTIFDPHHLLNPGKIIDAPPPDRHLRYGPSYRTIDITPLLDWSRDGSFAHAVEMCNGAGVCRKLEMGTMCPSFQALKDERHSTRGRANLLRAALTPAPSPADWPTPP
ncbi:MAG: FAD-binding oxidoreductase, partial [Caldilineae bacterium]